LLTGELAEQQKQEMQAAPEQPRPKWCCQLSAQQERFEQVLQPEIIVLGD
jgi:hypothetical protein